MQFKHIFTPIKIGSLEIKNRLAVGAILVNYVEEDGKSNERFIAYHEAKAQGGWGLIITENFPVSPEGARFKTMPQLFNDEAIPSHQELTRRVHAQGSKIFAQLYHAGRQTVKNTIGCQPVSASPIKDATLPDQPRSLSIDEIHTLVSKFGDAALRAQRSGFDGVEVHGGHGYLIEQFMSPASNKRSDQYGGSLFNRARFALEIIADIRRKCGADFPVIYRMSVNEYIDGGLSVGESKAIAMLLEEAGIDAIDCTQGVYASTYAVNPSYNTPKAFYENNAAEIKKVVNIPVIAVGRIDDPLIAEEIIASGKADMAIMAKASLADPELPNKTLRGDYEDIIHCIGCLQGCNGQISQGKDICCLVNPRTGQEYRYKFTKTAQPKNIYIAGGGVAGCEAAIVLAQKGHQVTLFEKSDRLGGQWLAAAVPIGKGEFTSFTVWQERQLQKLGVTVKFHTELTKAMVEQDKPETVIIATGGLPKIPPIPGIDDPRVALAVDVLSGKVQVGPNAVVIGGALTGSETADFLAAQGSNVTLCSRRAEIADDSNKIIRKYLLERLAKNKVRILTETKIVAIKDGCVYVDTKGTAQKLENIDTIVISGGVRSNNTLAAELKDYPGEVLTIGDASSVKDGFLNIREAYEKAFNI